MAERSIRGRNERIMEFEKKISHYLGTYHLKYFKRILKITWIEGYKQGAKDTHKKYDSSPKG